MATVSYRVGGGTPDYTVTLLSGATQIAQQTHNSNGTFNFDNVSNGFYTINVTDNLGCEIETTVNVNVTTTTTTTTTTSTTSTTTVPPTTDLMYGGVGPDNSTIDVDDSNTNTQFSNGETIRVWLSTDDDLTPNINLSSTFNTSITIIGQGGTSQNLEGKVVNVVNMNGVNIDPVRKSLGQVGTTGSIGNNNGNGENISIPAGTGRGYIDVELHNLSAFPQGIQIIISNAAGRIRTSHPLSGVAYGLFGNSSTSLVFQYQISA